MQALEHKAPPPLVFALIAAMMWIAARRVPTVPIDTVWRLGIAGVFVVFALLVATLAFASFGRAKTTVNPVDIEAASTLVTDGVFSYTRNPMYLSLTALLVGWAVYLSAPWVTIGPIVFLLFIARFQIIPEERVLRAKFGAQYASYENSVRRWL